MADDKISGLPSVTAAAANEFALVQGGVTSKDTIQGILDLVPAGSNLGSADLTSSANARVFTLNGATSSNTFAVEASGGQDIIKFLGDNDINIYSAANVNYGIFDQSAEKLKTANFEIGNIGTATQYASTTYSRLASTSGIARMFNSSGTSIVDIRQSVGHATLDIKNSSAVSKVLLSGSTGITLDDSMNIILDTTTGSKIATATSQKLGFWNATPIVQPTTAYSAATFAANTSGIADDTATWDSYTIGAVVGALRGAGILA